MTFTSLQQLVGEQVALGAWQMHMACNTMKWAMCIACVAAVKPAPPLARTGVEPLPNPGQAPVKPWWKRCAGRVRACTEGGR